MATEAQKKASSKWRDANYSRIPLDVPKDYHEELKTYLAGRGLTVRGYIMDAIDEKRARDAGAEKRIADSLPKALRTRVEAGASLEGVEPDDYILKAIETRLSDTQADFKPSKAGMLSGLISWLTDKGFSPEEIADCFLSIGKK